MTKYFAILILTLFHCPGHASSQYQGGEFSNYGQEYEDNGEQEGEGDEDPDYMNRKSVIKFEDVDDENEDEEREVGSSNISVACMVGQPAKCIREPFRLDARR